ncbi:hypothetical protein [Motilimonas eburnea]|uniref:DUF7878 domain-containing protein n=1 Tax=Motilimonas eburnea TaxID=1737488 RepID=UPI001E2D884E|nr:hypothetical protein [Motilimonas eburnea]MCE2571255.1 hypothetical protein [Motilimonas eburnea]
MTQISFELDNIKVDPEGMNIDEKYKALINIDANLTLRFDDDIVFAENFNFLELLASLKRWERLDFSGLFSFESFDFDDEGIFEFIPVENGFVFSSCWAVSTTDVTLSLGEVTDFVFSFDQVCRASVQAELGINIERFSL